MSEQSPRDTQFAGFARLLFEQLYNTGEVFFDVGDDYWKEQWRAVIAQRAYDLAKHIMSVMPFLINNANIPSLDAAMQYIQDMTAWPEETSE